MKKLLENIVKLSDQAVARTNTEDKVYIADAVLKMANAFAVVREIQLHEDFHISADKLPGENPIEKKDLM